MARPANRRVRTRAKRGRRRSPLLPALRARLRRAVLLLLLGAALAYPGALAADALLAALR